MIFVNSPEDTAPGPPHSRRARWSATRYIPNFLFYEGALDGENFAPKLLHGHRRGAGHELAALIL